MSAVQSVTIGQGMVFGPGHIVESNLGSCVGIVIAWPEEKRFGIAHCLLPDRGSKLSDTRYYRYCSSAAPYLLKRMRVPKERVRELRCYLSGGADLFNSGEDGVGAANSRVALSTLRNLRVRVIGSDLGGTLPRRIRIEPEQHRILVLRMQGGAKTIPTEWRLK